MKLFLTVGLKPSGEVDLLYAGKDRKETRTAQQEGLLSGRYEFVYIYNQYNSRLRTDKNAGRREEAKKALEIKKELKKKVGKAPVETIEEPEEPKQEVEDAPKKKRGRPAKNKGARV